MLPASVPTVAGTALIFGARNLGRAVGEHLASGGWNVAGVARSQETAGKFEQHIPGALGMALDASEPDAIDEAVRRAREHFGGAPIDLLVNAVAAGPSPSGGPFGGGPLADTSPEDFEHYAIRVARQVYAFLSGSARAARAAGGGTIVQITGGSSQRAIPGKGAWAAGAFATRALTQSAALELRDEGIHVALLVVDATIKSPKTASYTKDAGPHDLAEQDDVARAVAFLAEQQPTSWTHELQITPRGDRWVP
jgi:NAD(P)-dependent dehydrogenase (short-subunit alcohol dehydrogenase family)